MGRFEDTYGKMRDLRKSPSKTSPIGKSKSSPIGTERQSHIRPNGCATTKSPNGREVLFESSSSASSEDSSSSSSSEDQDDDDERVVAPTKRGRPEKWKPRVITEEDKTMEEGLVETFAPDTSHADAFQAKYVEFCKINKIKPEDGLLPALAQGRAMGAAFSSLKTNFTILMKRRPFNFSGAWKVKKILGNAAADSDDVQPRTTFWSKKQIIAHVSAIKNHADQAFAWTCAATGNRAGNVARLRKKQCKWTSKAIKVQWRWRKVNATRGKRVEANYLYEWSLEPPKGAIEYFKSRPDESLLWDDPRYAKKRASTTLTEVLRDVSGDESVTSYVFRDYHEKLHQEKKTPREEYQMLMDHDLHTGLAHYLVTAMKKKQIAPKKKEKKEAAKEKAKQKIAAKKMKARAEKKKTLKKTSSP